MELPDESADSSKPTRDMMAPEIVRWPENARFEPGGVVSFDVRVYGRPMPTVLWLHGTQPLEQSPDRQRCTYQPTNGDARLVLLNLVPADIGEYRLVARNPAGEVAAVAQLMSSEQYDAWLQKQPGVKPQSVTEQLSATLPLRAPPTAQASAAEAGPDQLPEFPVEAFENELRARKPSLAQSTDLDLDPAGSQREGLAPPVIVVPLPESLKVPEGAEPVLEALVHSDTPVRIRWYRDGAPIRATAGSRLQTTLVELKPEEVAALQPLRPGASSPLFLAQLRLGSVRPTDMGWFTVSATNAGGRDVCSGRLAVVPVSEIDESSFVSPHTLNQLERLRHASPPFIFTSHEHIYSFAHSSVLSSPFLYSAAAMKLN